MEIVVKKFFRFPLVLLVFLGLVFSLSCVFNHPEISAHLMPAEVGTVLAQGEETCCGTNLSQQHKLLNGEFLVIPKEMNRNPLTLLFVSLLVVSMIFGRRFLLDDASSRLSVLHKLYIRDYSHLPLFNYLILAFSRGILNSKKYNPAFSN